jgi:hypothetical protein
MNAAGRTATLAEANAEAPWPETVQLRVELADAYRLNVDRVEAQGDQLILFIEEEPAQAKLNNLVIAIDQIITENETKAVMVKRFTELYDKYEPETT